MKKYIHNYITRFKAVAGVEIQLLANNSMSVRYVKLRRKKHTVVFEKGEYHLTTLDELQQIVGKLPVALCITGKVIMNKMVPVEKSLDPEGYAKKALPKFSTEEFSVQITQNEGDNILSLVRKNVMTPILENLTRLQIQVITITIGPFNIVPLWDYLSNSASKTIIIDTHHFSTDTSNRITQYQLRQEASFQPKVLTFADHEINEKIAIAFATALCLIAPIDHPRLISSVGKANMTEFIMRRIFFKSMRALLIFFVITIILNSIAHLHYPKTTTAAAEKADSLRYELNMLKNTWYNDIDFIQRISNPRSHQTGLLAMITDRMIFHMPESIVLDHLLLFPQNVEESRVTRQPSYDFDKISIAGHVANSLDLYAWIESIRNIEVIKKVEIISYMAAENQNAEFELNLTLL